MQLVLEYGQDHPSLFEVVPPSPNSSSDSVRRQETIAQAHENFQSSRPVVPAPPRPLESPVERPVFPGFGPPDPEPDSAEPSDESVGDVEPEVVALPGVDDVVVDAPAPTGPRTESSISSSDASVIFPADNPIPRTVAGGYDALDIFIEFGAVRIDPATANWFKFSNAPTEFKIVAGADGQEFLFCMPDVDDVEVTQVETTGQRDVSFQVRPSTKVFSGQTDALTPPGTPPSTESAPSLEHDPDPVSDAGPHSGSADDTTATTTAEENRELLASAELTK